MSRTSQRCASLLLLLGVATACVAEEIRAYSLRDAERLLASGYADDPQLRSLGGITRFAGMVFDRQSQDVILVGKARADAPPASIDDLIVALRARLLKNEFPRVSIDRVAQTAKTGMQDVRFDGGIEGTDFGSSFLASDITLKRYSLDLLSRVPGVTPYLSLYETATRKKLVGDDKVVEQVQWFSEAESDRVVEENLDRAVSASSSAQSRFWFHVKDDESFIVERDDVFVIEELKLGVKAETLTGARKPAEESGSPASDPVGEQFAREFSEHFVAASRRIPELQRLKTLFDLVCIAEGVSHLGTAAPQFEHLLRRYQIGAVATPAQYRLVQRVGEFRDAQDVVALVEVSGGIDLDTLLLALEDGDVSALKTAVLGSRPSPDALTWTVPLDDWAMPNDFPHEPIRRAANASGGTRPPKNIGFGISVQRVVFDQAALSSKAVGFKGFPAPPAMPKFASMTSHPTRIERMLSPSERYEPSIGGVMLRGVADVRRADGTNATPAAGDFALLVQGLDRGAPPADLRKFITALWSVYYSREDPGISIDPVGWGADKQLVRYIGRVVNTDLGRVMREADYTMKKWAVGTEWPTIPGFRDVDAIAGREGLSYADAFRRFWFVPEAMRFTQSDDALLFDSGRMTLKTELLLGQRATGVVPADQKFAEFFTEHYSEIARHYPIYQELLDYAKLVSLAKYLKASGVPLQWFLLASLDQVLTESSRGTVDTLSRGSQFFDQVRIEGGVEMAGRYVLDRSAAVAIQRSEQRVFSRSVTATTRATTDAPQVFGANRSFEMRHAPGTVAPATALASGSDLRGTEYQTDIAVRLGTEPGLELIRYRSNTVSTTLPGEFGSDWHLLRPYRLKLLGPPQIAFLNVLVPERFAIVNELTGEEETLTFDDHTYELHGYRPQNFGRSRFIGLFWTAAGGMRLVDKIGNEFWFDDALMLSEMHLAEDYGVQFEYGFEEVSRSGYAAAPAHLAASGNGTVADYVSVNANGQRTALPSRLLLSDSAGERQFTFTTRSSGEVGYASQVPNDDAQTFIFLRGDGRYVWVDQHGDETWFDQTLAFEKRRFLRVKAVKQGAYRYDDATGTPAFVATHSVGLDYAFDGKGVRVTTAKLYEAGTGMRTHETRYRYAGGALLDVSHTTYAHSARR